MKKDKKVKDSTLSGSMKAAEPAGSANESNKQNEHPMLVTTNNEPPPAQKGGESQAKLNLELKPKYKRLYDELIPIRVPPEEGWTYDRDLQYVGYQVDDYCRGFDELVIRAFDSLQDLSTLLRRAVTYLDADVDERVELTVPDLIDLLDKQLQSCLSAETYVKYFAEDIDTCQFVNQEFHRLLGIYAANIHLLWLTPWADLGDWVGAAKTWLEASLVTVFPDFEDDGAVGLSEEAAPRSAV